MIRPDVPEHLLPFLFAFIACGTERLFEGGPIPRSAVERHLDREEIFEAGLREDFAAMIEIMDARLRELTAEEMKKQRA